MYCICLICLTPNTIWLDFFSKFTNYDIVIIIDDNSIDYTIKYKSYTNIKCIQIKNEECNKNGFVNMNFCINKKISGWDKAIFYFSNINTSYTNVWFIEDDVFFYDENTLLNIDKKYNDINLLTAPYKENSTGHKDDWHWKKINIKSKPPYYYSMVCATRISRILLSKIKDYAIKYKTLFFLETLFPTLCKSNNLQYDIPDELHTIVYRKIYTIEDINKNNLYHPIKDITKHTLYRNKLDENTHTSN